MPTYAPAFCRLHVTVRGGIGRVDYFALFVIDQSNYFGIGLMTPAWELLYTNRKNKNHDWTEITAHPTAAQQSRAKQREAHHTPLHTITVNMFTCSFWSLGGKCYFRQLISSCSRLLNKIIGLVVKDFQDLKGENHFFLMIYKGSSQFSRPLRTDYSSVLELFTVGEHSIWICQVMHAHSCQKEQRTTNMWLR